VYVDDIIFAGANMNCLKIASKITQAQHCKRLEVFSLFRNRKIQTRYPLMSKEVYSLTFRGY